MEPKKIHKTNLFTSLFVAMRPLQWTKNAVVFAALGFGFGDSTQQIDLLAGLLLVVPAALLFCLCSSGVYLINDLMDLKSDREHPAKRYRPLASGRIRPIEAAVAAAVLLAIALGGGWLLSRPFFMVLMGYTALQIVYSLILKRVALLDVFIIAAGFVLRAIAGAAVFQEPPSRFRPGYCSAHSCWPSSWHSASAGRRRDHWRTRPPPGSVSACRSTIYSCSIN